MWAPSKLTPQQWEEVVKPLWLDVNIPLTKVPDMLVAMGLPRLTGAGIRFHAANANPPWPPRPKREKVPKAEAPKMVTLIKWRCADGHLNECLLENFIAAQCAICGPKDKEMVHG